MLKRLSLALAFVFLVAPLIAAPGDLKLQFEIYKNGTLIGNPMLTVEDGGTASMSLPNARNWNRPSGVCISPVSA